MHRPLDDDEYAQVWDRFETAFSFAPSTTVFPGIHEPVPSTTWRLTGATDDLEAAVRSALTTAAAGGALLALDWQHTSYRFTPAGDWPLDVIPNGDYRIVLDEDMTFGSFGHPWENSLCVFGLPVPYTGPVLRRDGITE